MVIEKTRNRYGWYVVFISALIGVSMTASFPQFTMVVGEYAEKLNTSQEFLLFTDTVKAISIMVSMLFSGPVYKRLGLKKTFIFAISTMVIPQMLMPFALNGAIVLIFKIIQGFCAVIFPVFIITIMGWMDKRNMGTATAVFNGIFYGGSGIGATIAGFTISTLGWKQSFYTIGIMTIVPSILWLFTVKENDKGLEKTGDGEVPKDDNTFKTVIKSFKTWALVICLFSTIWMVQVLSVDLPLYGGYYKYDSESIGLIMSSLSVGIFLACIVSGRISDYFAIRSEKPAVTRLIVFSFGPVLTIVSILLLFIINKENFMFFYAAMLLLSFTGAWGLGSFYCILPELMEKSMVEYATGFIGGIADIAMPVGPFVVGVIFGVKGLWIGAWLTCISVCVVSIIGSLLLIVRIRSREICHQIIPD